MRCVGKEIPWITTHNPFNGGAGQALYVSPAGISDPKQINYRNSRVLPVGPASVCDEFPAIGDGPLGLDAHVALIKTPDPLTWNLPDEYADTSFALNVRPHADGLELDTISGAQIVNVADGEDVGELLGSVQVLQISKLDGGGVRMWFRYYAPPESPPPDSFEIRDTAEPATIATVSVAAQTDHNYYVELAGLADATDYAFAIVGLIGVAETSLTTFAVTGDDAGPDADITLTAEVW